MTGLIDQYSKEQRIAKAVELRRAGKSLDDIAEQVGYSREWVCKLLQKAGEPVPKITYDKRGSARTKHGMRRSPIYWSWYSMKTRCSNPHHADYPNWGGRGITYDPRWECFLNFLEDMGDRPSKKHSLERIDNSKGYCKENCKWILKSLQCRNSRAVKLSEKKAADIRRKYANGGYTYRDLAQVYMVSPTVIGAIITGRIWKEVA